MHGEVDDAETEEESDLEDESDLESYDKDDDILDPPS